MRYFSLILAFLYGSFILLIFPFLFTRLNHLLLLPVYGSPFIKLLGLGFMLLGGAVWLRCINLFRLIGKGTPVPVRPPRKLVESGLYKRSRNPMYINTLLVLLGYFFYFGHVSLLGYTILVFLFFHLFVVYYEEPTLRRKFGKRYLGYCNRVPRWL
ncbi:MAG: isoprenylcysteine carboxylmethyltransferase family protein [Patescibacteria group bacterium]